MATRKGKVKTVVAYLDEIERIQCELREVVSRETRRRAVGERSIDEITSNDSSSTCLSRLDHNLPDTKMYLRPTVDSGFGYSANKWKTNDRSGNETADASESSESDADAISCRIKKRAILEHAEVETKKNNEDDVEPFDILNYFRFLTNPRTPRTTTQNATVQTFDLRESPDIEYFYSNDNRSKTIHSSVDAVVQTTKKTKIHSEPFDILNYFQVPNKSLKNPQTSSSSSSIVELNSGQSLKTCRSDETAANLRKLSVDKASNTVGEMLKSERTDLEGSPKKRKMIFKKSFKHRDCKAVQHDQKSSYDVDIFKMGKRARRAAAVGRRGAPASSAYKQQQQVHASEMKLRTGEPRLQARSQGTRPDGSGHEKIRVPVPKQRASWMTIKWLHPIGLRSGSARMLSDRGGSEPDQQHEKIEMGQDGKPMQEPKRIKRLDNQDGIENRIMPRWLQHIGKLSSATRHSADLKKIQQKQKLEKKMRRQKNSESMQRQEPNDKNSRWKNRIFIRFGLGSKINGRQTRTVKQHKRYRSFSKRIKKRIVRKTSNFGLLGLFGCSRCVSRRSSRAGVTVPYHYPGDRTPRLVEKNSIISLDDTAETLRVISSAVKVSIGQGDNVLRL